MDLGDIIVEQNSMPVMSRGRIKLDEGDGEQTPAGKLLRRLVALAWTHKWAAVPALIATVGAQALTVASAAVQGQAINYIQSEATQAGLSDMSGQSVEVIWLLGIEPPSEWSVLRTTIAMGMAIVFIALVAGIGRFAQRVADEFFAQACIVDLRTQLYRKLQSLGFTFFDDHDTGQIIQRITQDTNDVRMFLQGVMVQVVISAITLTIFLSWMLTLSPLLTLASLAFIPIQIIAVVRYGKRTKPRFKHHSSLVDKVVQHYKESIEGVRVIRVFGKALQMFERFRKRSITARDYRIDLARESARTIPLLMSSNMFTQAFLLGVGGLLILRGDAAGGITLGVLWQFFALMRSFGGQVESIVMVAAQAPTALAGADRVFKLLDADPDIANAPGAAMPADQLAGHVRFENVSFGYLSGETVLHDVSFEARPGETIAIVGPTGSGKSTLLSLIARFYDPDQGNVFIDGMDVQSMPIQELRRSVGFVFQESFLFSNSVRNNVAFGQPNLRLDEIQSATAAAAATGFIDELEHGYDTVIGERGVSLSGGQRQRLALARALILRPSILILDDATGSVDAITEAHIQAALEEHLGERTTFVVAHRLSTLRRANRIIVLERGRVIDTGTHEELMKREGHYRAAALIQLQIETNEHPSSVRTTSAGDFNE